MAKVTYDQYLANATSMQTRVPSLRLGQCLERILSHDNSALHAEVVYDMEIDPFWDDELVPFFLEVVRFKWPSPK